MNLLEAYYNAVFEVNIWGKRGLTEDNEKVITLNDPLTLHITHPTTHTKFPPGLKERAARVYAKQMLYPLNDSNFSYTYGERARSYAGHIDQVSGVIKRFKESKVTRRAVISLYNPTIDSQSNEIPCLNHLEFRIVNRNGCDELDCYALFRSQDILSALFLNAYGITGIMNYVKDALQETYSLTIGNLIITSNIPHIYYERDASILDQVKKEIMK
ncbi:MAG: thymidylate synthase [Candidatus Methanomethylophilaceae archaeon]|jgi:thymidylate synthase